MTLILGVTDILRYIKHSIRKINQKLNTLRDYAAVGVLATVTHYILLYILVDALSLFSPISASMIGFLAGASVGFICNSKLVFKQSKLHVSSLSKYTLLILFNFISNALQMFILTRILMLEYLLAQLITTTIIFGCNYVVCKLWIFTENTYVKQPCASITD